MLTENAITGMAHYIITSGQARRQMYIVDTHGSDSMYLTFKLRWLKETASRVSVRNSKRGTFPVTTDWRLRFDNLCSPSRRLAAGLGCASRILGLYMART